ncbi:hypothetical protein [Serratia liquefaciens]|uniref:hypothetical protein n=1 Tax=Serratia liquefaciens TaxID=614 RepID=UPI0022B9AF9F|nr:hypothetical protein [Serratia liquefaciens]
MSYNQKVWLGVLVLCSLFWLTVIGGVLSVHKVFDRAQTQNQQEFTAKYSQHYQGTATSGHTLQARSPTS